MSLGPYQSLGRRRTLRHSHLINNDDEELSAIYINVAIDLMRVGVTCRPSTGPYVLPENLWGETPQTSSPTAAFDDHWYFSRADLSCYHEFQACIDRLDDDECCIGLLLHGPDGSHSIGQWRWDKHVTARNMLPSSLLLEGFVQRSMPQVKLVDQLSDPSAIFAPLRGILEWWTGALGAKVSCVTLDTNAEFI